MKRSTGEPRCHEAAECRQRLNWISELVVVAFVFFAIAPAIAQSTLPEQTIFTFQTPDLPDALDGVPYELGTKFQSEKPGKITALRYWKSAGDTGTHVGTVWSADGALLARVTFSAETQSGWQQQTLAAPLPIQPNVTYIVSVSIDSYFPISYDVLSSSVTNGDLRSVSDGSNGVFSGPGEFPTRAYRNSNYFRDVVFVADTPGGGQTLLTTQVPVLRSASDGVSYELGMKFRAARTGQVRAIRHWKADDETGTHIGRIWSANGTLLDSVTFLEESVSGWQVQSLATPLQIQPDTTYIVSVNITSNYPFTGSGLVNPIVNGDLSSVADGINGIYGAAGRFPTNSYQSSNYFRDIVFEATSVPNLAKIGGDNQSGTYGIVLPVPLVVQVRDASNNPVPNAAVNFAIAGGAGTVSPASAVTGSDGSASTSLTLGNSNGPVSVSATVAGIGSVIFTALIGNAIFFENQKAGTPNFLSSLTQHYSANVIAGYADALSINRGGTINFKVTTTQPGPYSVEIYRLGYYGGLGGRFVATSPSLTGAMQKSCAVTDRETRLIECDWPTAYALNVGADWTTGLYMAKLVHGSSGTEFPIFFIVRDDGHKSDVVFQSSRTTAIAYNSWGNADERYSLYGYSSSNGTPALKVSLDRPSLEMEEYSNLLAYEYNMARWLESQGYDVSYVTNLDVHSNPKLLLDHKVFLSVGHDEYWSKEMRDAVEQARDVGINLGFFSANTAYWRVRFEPSSSGVPNRVMVCYKDPIMGPDPIAPTYRWRDPPNNRPENAMLGVMYIGDNSANQYGGFDFVVANATDPYFSNTGLNEGAVLSGLVGYEWDAVVDNGFTPAGLVVLGKSPVTAGTIAEGMPQTAAQIAHTVRYTAPGGAKVFSTGSIQWLWGLDSDRVNPSRADSRLQQMFVNVLGGMGARPSTPNPGLILP